MWMPNALKIFGRCCCCNNALKQQEPKWILVSVYIFEMSFGVVRLSVDRKSGVVWGHSNESSQEPVDLGKKGARLLKKIDALYRTRRAEFVYTDEKEKSMELRRGEYVWGSMCATLNVPTDLPVGFRYVTYDDSHDLWKNAFVVFNGFTAVFKRDSHDDIHVTWETQDGEPGWIGLHEWPVGRGHVIPANECPVASVLEWCPVGTNEILETLIYARTGYAALYHRVYRMFGLREPYPCTRFNMCGRTLQNKDGRSLQNYNEAPLAAVHDVLPEFFAPVRNNIAFWNEMHRAYKQQ